MTCYNLNPLKTYVQFNDLVIDSAEEISSASLKQDTKTATQEYSYGHGSYVAFQKNQQFLTEGDLSLTLNFNYEEDEPIQNNNVPQLQHMIEVEIMKCRLLFHLSFYQKLIILYLFLFLKKESSLLSDTELYFYSLGTSCKAH